MFCLLRLPLIKKKEKEGCFFLGLEADLRTQVVEQTTTALRRYECDVTALLISLKLTGHDNVFSFHLISFSTTNIKYILFSCPFYSKAEVHATDLENLPQQ